MAMAIQRIMPSKFRKWQRDLIPSTAQSQIDALYAELETLLPEALAANLIRRPSYVYPDSQFENLLSEKQWLANLKRAELVLKEIHQITIETQGPTSEATALSHFSLSLYYYFSSYHQEAILKMDVNERPHHNYNEFHALAIGHGKKARDLLYTVESPIAIMAHLQLIKVLERSSLSLSLSNVTNLVGEPIPPEPKYLETLDAAESEIRSLLSKYMSQGLSTESEAWIYVNAMLISYSLESHKDTMAKRARGDKMTAFGYDNDPVHDQKAYERSSDILQIALANRKALSGLLQEKDEGALFLVIQNLRWANYPFQFHRYTYVSQELAEKRNELLWNLEQSLRQGVTLEMFLETVREMGFNTPSNFESIE